MYCSNNSEGDNRLVVFSIPLEHFTSRLADPKHTTPIETIFVVDTSGSMKDPVGNTRKISLVKDGIIQFIKYVAPFSEYRDIFVTIIGFNTSAQTIVASEKLTIIDNDNLIFKVSALDAYGGTNIQSALNHTNSHIDSVKLRGVENISVFFLTDGYHNDESTKSSMISEFSISPHRSLYYGMGLGRVDMYDAELLMSLFKTQVSGSPTSNAVLTGIIDVSFSGFIDMYKNTVFTPNEALLKSYNVSTTLENSDIGYMIKSFNVSKRIPFFLTKKLETEIESDETKLSDEARFDVTYEFDDALVSMHFPVFTSDSAPLEGKFVQRYFESVNKYKTLLNQGELITPTEMNIRMKTLLTTLTSPPVPEDHPISDYHSDLVMQIETFTQNFRARSLNSAEYSALCSLGSAQADRQISEMALRSVTERLSRNISATVTSQFGQSRTSPTMEIETNCSICLEESLEAMTLPCKHVSMCNKCAQTSLETSDKCPVCRQEISSVVVVTVSRPDGICMECNKYRANTIFRPCSHVVMCDNCVTKRLKSCPDCSAPIEKVLRVYVP
jgi:uncharacterized protein YegL